MYHIVLCLVLCFYFISCSCVNSCYAKRQEGPTYSLFYEQGVRYRNDGDLQNAVLYINNALNLNPNSLPALIELSEILLELKKTDLALSTLERALSVAPNDALIHFLLGIAYEENNQLNEAKLSFKNALKLDSDNVLIRSKLGLACLLSEDNKCAIDNLGKVVLGYPKEIRARAALGTSYHLAKEYGLAKDQYKFVLGLEPLNLTLLYNLAKTQIVLLEFEDAHATLDKAISINDTTSDLYLDRAYVLYKLGKLEDADSDYLKALKIDPQNPNVPIEYSNFLSWTGAYSKAAVQVEKALELQADDLALLVNKAYFLQLAKDNTDEKKVVNAWNDVLTKDPRNEIALFNLARFYQGKEDFNNAVSYFSKLYSINNEDKEVKAGLAFCFQKNNELDKAREIYESILVNKPDDVTALYNLGTLFISEEKYKDAIAQLEKAIKNNFPKPNKAYQYLVDAYTNLNDVFNLKATYMRWLGTDKENVEIRTSYAKFLAKTGDTKTAIDQYRIAAALDNTSKSRYKLAQFLLENKDLYGAVGELQEYLKAEPNDLNALVLLANTFKNLGIQEEAINTYKKIISIEASNHLAYYNLGLLYELHGQYEQAQNFLLKAIELNDKYAPAYYALGLSYIAVDDKDKKAKELFEKYLELDPRGEYKEKVEAKLKELWKAI